MLSIIKEMICNKYYTPQILEIWVQELDEKNPDYMWLYLAYTQTKTQKELQIVKDQKE